MHGGNGICFLGFVTVKYSRSGEDQSYAHYGQHNYSYYQDICQQVTLLLRLYTALLIARRIIRRLNGFKCRRRRPSTGSLTSSRGRRYTFRGVGRCCGSSVCGGILSLQGSWWSRSSHYHLQRIAGWQSALRAVSGTVGKYLAAFRAFNKRHLLFTVSLFTISSRPGLEKPATLSISVRRYDFFV